MLGACLFIQPAQPAHLTHLSSAPFGGHRDSSHTLPTLPPNGFCFLFSSSSVLPRYLHRLVVARAALLQLPSSQSPFVFQNCIPFIAKEKLKTSKASRTFQQSFLFDVPPLSLTSLRSWL